MTRVPYTGDEKASLVASLDRHRDAVLWKLEGLDDRALRRPMTPSGTSLLGIVKFFARARAAADQVIAELNLEATGTAWFGDTVTLRWTLIHVLEDTARHAGRRHRAGAHRRHDRRSPPQRARRGDSRLRRI